jgi:hypothetical protein
MNIHTLKSNIAKSRNAFIGRILNTKKNLNYLKDLESWGSLEIVNSNEAYIEYRLI